MVSSVSVVAQYRTEEIPRTIALFRKLDYTDQLLYKSGLFKDAIESHFWLLENSGRSLDSVFIEMQISIDAMLEKLITNEELSKFEIPKEFSEELKSVMEYTFGELTQESTSSTTVSKKKITELKKKINTLEERFALGEINQEIYTKFKLQYQEELKAINENLDRAPISSSNLEKAIKKATEYSSKLSILWGS